MTEAAGREERTRARTGAEHVSRAVTDLVRWATRGDVRRRLAGPAGQDLSPTDMWLLVAIEDQGPVRASDLAAWQGVDKSTVTPQVRRLEDRGLVAREADPVDRRAVRLTITAQGRRVHRRTAAAATAVVDGALADWDDADREDLARLLTRFVADVTRRGLR